MSAPRTTPSHFDQDRDRAFSRFVELGKDVVRKLHSTGALPQHWEGFAGEWLDKPEEAPEPKTDDGKA